MRVCNMLGCILLENDILWLMVNENVFFWDPYAFRPNIKLYLEGGVSKSIDITMNLDCGFVISFVMDDVLFRNIR